MIYPFPYQVNTAEIFKLFAADPWAVFLDSCAPHSAGRYDIIAFQPKVTVQSFQDHSVISFADGGIETSTLSPFDVLKKYTLKSYIKNAALPFTGGAIGYFSYDLCRTLEKLPTLAADDCFIPLMQAGIYDTCIVFDHQKKQAWFIAESERKFSDYCNKPAIAATPFQLTEKFTANFTKASYTTAFNKIKQHIYEGDCYQINLTQQFSASYIGSPWDAYQFLRAINPAPYSAYFNFPTTTVMSFSPEQFIRCQENHVITKPIKGTRRRNVDPEIDQQQKNSLLQSEKDRAENIMIVDLLRNDLGKVCEYGSVHVSKLCALESFANVHHLVSTVEGKLQQSYDCFDLLKACFPGGSITGTPKIRAMEIIEALEPNRRNIYCGSLGFIDASGDLDLNIAIRTLYTFNHKIYAAAGGAIVADSNVDAEYQECFDKIRILLQSLETRAC